MRVVAAAPCGRLAVHMGHFCRAAASTDQGDAHAERLRVCLEVSSQWWWETDAEARITQLSEHWQTLTGMTAEALIGHSLGELPGAVFSRETGRRLAAALAARAPVRDLRFAMIDDTYNKLWMAFSGDPAHDETGRFLGYRGAGRLISAEIEAARHLVTARAQLQDVIESPDEGFALYDIEDRLILCNQAYRQTFLGVADHVEPGASFADLTRAALAAGAYPQAKDSQEAWLAARVAARDKGAYCGEIALSDGRWMLERDRRVASGNIVSRRIEITERKRSEDAMRILSRAFEQSPSAVIITDTEGRIEYVNNKFTEVTGYAAEEAIGQTPSVFKSGNTSAYQYAELWKTIGGGGIWQGEVLNKHKDGSLQWELVTIGPIKAPGGTITNYLAVKENITQRKTAEAQLQYTLSVRRALNRLLRISQFDTPVRSKLEVGFDVIFTLGLFDVLPLAAVYLADQAETTLRLFMQVNLQGEGSIRQTSIPFGDGLCGETARAKRSRVCPQVDVDAATHFIDEPPMAQAFMPMMRGQKVLGVVVFCLPVGQTCSDHELSFLSGIADIMGLTIERDRAAEALMRHRDDLQSKVDEATTKLREKANALELALAKEKELNTMQRQFVSMASHELRTPLTIIDSNAQKIVRRFDQMERHDLAERITRIRGAVQRMTSLIEGTLSAARLDAGKVTVTPEPCDLAAVVREVCERQQEVATRHIIRVDLQRMPAQVVADARAIDQVFTNLLSNAVKYAPDNPEIEVRGWTEGGDVLVSVEDHGLGIAAEDLPRLGERFFRAATSVGIRGTGIGLNLAKQLVEMHGGVIDVASKEGAGSRFTVRLPVSGVAAVAEVSQPVGRAGAAERGS